MVNCPLCAVVSVGLKVTDTLQLLPGANVLMHWLLAANGAAAVSPVIDISSLDFFELSFLIVIFLALLTLPTSVLSPKFKESGLNVSVPTPGVGVAVGVEVAVAVAVAVGVALVAVGVEVGVAVTVVVAVAVGVAVLLGVAVLVDVADPVDVGVDVGVAVDVAVVVSVAVAVAVAVGVGDGAVTPGPMARN